MDPPTDNTSSDFLATGPAVSSAPTSGSAALSGAPRPVPAACPPADLAPAEVVRVAGGETSTSAETNPQVGMMRPDPMISAQTVYITSPAPANRSELL